MSSAATPLNPSFGPATLGRSGLRVSRLGLSTGGGALPSREIERAFDRGLRYFYFGSLRGRGFGAGLRAVAKAHRAEIVTVIQSYTRAGMLMKGSIERALKTLAIEYTDVLLLGWWNDPPPARILDVALELKARGIAKHLMISCHNRNTFARYAKDPSYEAIMVRYNAVHPGAEQDVFPLLGDPRPGVVAYTATRWGHLLDPSLMPSGEPHPRSSDCYRFALSHPSVDVALCAPRTASELDDALLAIDRGAMSEDELAWMKRVGAHVKRVTSGSRRISPINMLDRIVGWCSSGEQAST